MVASRCRKNWAPMTMVIRAMALTLLLCVPGCFSERSFPMNPSRLVLVAPAQVERADGARLPAREWVPRGNEIPGSFVIVTHGLFGSMDGEDVRNHVQALRQAGHHVLALEMRGHGRTQIEHPEYIISFGIRECDDLLEAARWLKATH